jgi:hypothetical protein
MPKTMTHGGAERSALPETAGGFYAAGVAPAAATLLVIALTAAASLCLLRPPAPRGADAPPSEFSARRALEHLKVIARSPHPAGSPEHELARRYLVEQLGRLGLEVEVQSAGGVSNVVARRRGTGGGGAVLFAAHYDTVPGSPGAGDDGAAVAALLEALRALGSGPPLANDLIILFSDGEELGLLGAQAFAYRHPWSADVKVVFNFDARGDSGPVLMFETTPGNGWLIGHFARAARTPVANSLMFEIYRRLPNDTDFTVFKNRGTAGLNFACIGGFAAYHSRYDSVENLSERTTQDVGEQALALMRHFGAADLGETRAPDAVYFDLLGTTLVSYPASWSLPLAGLTAALFAAVVALGARRRRLRLTDVGFGSLALLASMVGAAVVLINAVAFIKSRHGAAGAALHPDTAAGQLYACGLLAFTAATVAALNVWFRRHASAEGQLIGAALVWLPLTLCSAWLWPGASYLFTWPLLFALLAAACLLVAPAGGATSPRCLIPVLLCAVPGVVLIVPLVYLILVGLTLSAAAGVMMPLVMLAGLLAPHFGIMSLPHRWLLPCAAALAGAACFVAAGAI